MLGEALETELLRNVMDIKNDIHDIKMRVNDFEQGRIVFTQSLKNVEEKVSELEAHLNVLTFGVERIEKREVFYIRMRRFIKNNIFKPIQFAMTKGVTYIVLMGLAVVLTWLLTLFNISPDAKQILEVIK